MAEKHISAQIKSYFSAAANRQNLTSGEEIQTSFGKIAKWLSDFKTVAFTGSYNDLSNKPTIPAAVAVKGNAETSYRTGNVNLTPANIGAATTAQGTKADNAIQTVQVNGTAQTKTNNTVNISLDKSSVGLENVDNTSDLNKPISTATQTALNAQQAQIDDNSEVSEVTDTTPYLYKSSEHDAVYDELVGGSVAWNQLVQNGNFESTSRWSGRYSTISVSNNVCTVTPSSDGTFRGLIGVDTITDTTIAGHKYLISVDVLSPVATNIALSMEGIETQFAYAPANVWIRCACIWTNTSSTRRRIYALLVDNVTTSQTIMYKNVYTIDLTQMFGTTIADYVYNLEQSTAGSGIVWLKSYGFFTKDYYAYNAGGLVSVNTSGKKVVGKNLLEITTESTTINGVTFTVDKVAGTITANGTASANTSLLLSPYPKGNGNVIISATNNASCFYTLSVLNGGNAFVGRFIQIVNDVEVNYDNESRDIGLFLGIDSGTTISNLVLKPMIRRADVTDSTFEPYTSLTYPIQSTDLRGLYKLSGTKLYTDGDIYSSDGTVTRKYGYRDYQSGDESLANAITDGTHTIYKLSAPTTETASSYTSPQMVYRSGTEEYLDARDVPMPVGGNRKYVDIPDWMVNEYFDDVRVKSEIVSQKAVRVEPEMGDIGTLVFPDGIHEIDWDDDEGAIDFSNVVTHFTSSQDILLQSNEIQINCPETDEYGGLYHLSVNGKKNNSARYPAIRLQETYSGNKIDIRNNAINLLTTNANSSINLERNIAGSSSTSGGIMIDSGGITIHCGDNALVLWSGGLRYNGNTLPVTNITNAGFHNSIYRGKFLGTSYTSAQKAQVQAGTFDDLFVGDYWIINGVNWRIADINYYLHTGDTETKTPHLVIVPDESLANSGMNFTDTTGAYAGSYMNTTTLLQDGTEASDSVFGKIKAAFGEENLLSIRQLFANAVDSNGNVSGWAWYSTRCFLMNQCMVYGHKAWANGNKDGFNVGIDKTQLALFAHNPTSINTRQTYWLRDVCSSDFFTFVNDYGSAGGDLAFIVYGVRPVFLLKGA